VPAAIYTELAPKNYAFSKFCKYYSFALTQYERVVTLDGDTVVKADMMGLFSIPIDAAKHPIAAADETVGFTGFNSGVVIYMPSTTGGWVGGGGGGGVVWVCVWGGESSPSTPFYPHPSR
jgi:hypothetical protein